MQPLKTTLTSPDLEGGSRGIRVRHLHVVMSPRELERAMLPLTGAVVIGREPGTGGLTLPDDECSRKHARLEPVTATDTWRVSDLGSRNGLWVGGERVPNAELTHGTVVRVGSSILVYTDVTLTPDEPLAAERVGLLGRSLLMQRVRGEIDLIGPRDTSVVVLGESGVGKERVAEALHQTSKRGGRFVAVNCAAIPAGIAEAELFGHVAGAFTGATSRADGLFVAADGGTLFLDEVGELPPELQAKLLRALSGGEVRAIGASDPQRVDVRIVAATNRDLEAELESGGFRGDLWARLAAWRIDIPPLRRRREDILGLVESFLPSGARLATNAAEALVLYDWPYNVRELGNVARTAGLRAGDGPIRTDHLPPAISAEVPSRTGGPGPAGATPLAALVDRTRTPTKEDLELVLRRLAGSVALVAEFFGRDRRQVYRWIERHGIDADAMRPQRDDG